MTTVCYNRFRIRTTNPESRRRIACWLFRSFTVYSYESQPTGFRGRFIASVPTFPRAAFRDLCYGLRGDETLEVHVVSYDLHTLYLEGHIYLRGRWHSIRL